jgi:RNA polymerase sigma-70 factor (ECF subfamily)
MRGCQRAAAAEALDMSEGNVQHDLIAQAIGGDRAALERLLLEHYTGLSRHVAPKLARPLDGPLGADDIVQETFVHAIRDIGKCRSRTERSFAAWLNRIADRRVLDAAKRLKRKKRGGGRARVGGPPADRSSSMADLVALLSSDGRTPSQSAARHEAVQAVQVGIAALPDPQREAVRLHHLGGKSIEQTAAAMGRTPGAVRGLLRRANQSLREALVRSTWWLSKK